MRWKDIFVYFNFCTVNMSLIVVHQATLAYSKVVQKDIPQGMAFGQLGKMENPPEVMIYAGEQSPMIAIARESFHDRPG